MTDVAEVEVTGVAAIVAAGGILLDVREPEEWEAGHAPRARHIPLGLLPDQLADLAGANAVVVICRSGSRSALATEWLTTAGGDAANVLGGMQAWAEAGLAVETDAGAPGRVI